MMPLLTKMVILILELVSLSLADEDLFISAYWSGVVTEGREGKIACRASGQITKCRWRKEGERRAVVFDSGELFDIRDNVMVTIGRSAGGEEDNMCFLTIMKTEIYHSGEWSCRLH
jgi:hypothetical protein